MVVYCSKRGGKKLKGVGVEIKSCGTVKVIKFSLLHPMHPLKCAGIQENKNIFQVLHVSFC